MCFHTDVTRIYALLGHMHTHTISYTHAAHLDTHIGERTLIR